MSPETRTGRRWVWSWLGYVLAVTIAMVAYDAFVSRPLFYAFPNLNWGFGEFPGYDDPNIRLLDLTLGLLLVAVVEETLARGLLRRIYEKYFTSVTAMVLVTSLLFAVMHWGHGPIGMAAAFVAGLLLVFVYLKSNSLLPCVASHYLINLAFFS